MRRPRGYEPVGMTHLGTLLAEAIGDGRRVQQALGVWPAWEEAVGPQIAAAARPVALRDGVLIVHVRHAVWVQELEAMHESLLQRVRKVSSGRVVRALRFRVGELPRSTAPEPLPPRPVNAAAPVPIEVADTIRRVPHPALREAIHRLASRWATTRSPLERPRQPAGGASALSADTPARKR